MNRKEIKKFIDRTWGQGKSDMETILKEISINDYKFDKDEVIEIFISHYGQRGEFFTPNNLSELIASVGHIYNPKSIIDICCGTGNILHYFNDKQILKGIDINSNIILLAKSLNPKNEYVIADTLKYDFTNSKYDLVISNAPFGGRTQDNKSLEIELMKKGLSILNKNGTAIFIVAEGILFNQNRSVCEFRNQIISEFALDMIISLPQSAFYPYAGVKTSVLVMRNGKPNEDVFMPSYNDNTKEIVSNFINHKGNFYVPLSKLENRYDRNYYLSVVVIEEKLKGKEVKKLSEIAEIINGRVINKDSFKSDGKYLVYKRKDKNGKDCYVNEITDENISLKPNDLVISILSTDKNIYVHSAKAPETIVNENFVIIRSKDNNYINTYLQTQQGRDFLWQQVDRHSSGSVIPRLTLSSLLDFVIPILPLSELDFVSEEWLKSASTEKLVQIETKLKGLISEYEKGSQHLIILNEILLKVNSQEEISKRIEDKIDIALTALQKLNTEISAIKNNKREDEEKISRMYFEIDNKLKQLTKEQEKEISYYQNEIKKWLDDWQLLHASSSNFLTSAELIFDHLPEGLDTDYSPFIIQYCRALENEILKKLFEAYHENLLTNNIDRKNLVASDSVNEKTQIFVKFVARDKRDYTLGNMTAIMSFLKEGGNTLKGSPLLQNFRTFTLTYFEDKVLQKEFLDSINNITANYRNKSAHPYILTLETAKACQKLIRHILTEFLHNYKQKKD